MEANREAENVRFVARQSALALNGAFGGLNVRRLEQFREIVLPQYPNIAPLPSTIPIVVFTNETGNITVTPQSITFNVAAGLFDVARAEDVYRHLDDAGLCPDLVAPALQVTRAASIVGIKERFFHLLPWIQPPHGAIIGNGSRFAFKDERDGSTIDLTIETDFQNDFGVIFSAKWGTDEAFATERAFALVRDAVTRVDEELYPLMLRTIQAPQ